MRTLIASALVTLTVLLGAPAIAATPSGTALGVDPAASSLFENTTRTLTVGSDIFLGDKITTGPNGQVQIVFSDNTHLVIGPDSTLTIEDYLIRNDGSAGKLVVDMLGGSFRFATGDSAKDNYLINTPTGTIGVRGTLFDVFVDIVTGKAWVMVYEGETLLTEGNAPPEVLTGLCHVGLIDVDDTELFGHADTFEGDARDDLKGWFRYSLDQSPLLREFWAPNANRCTHKPPEINTPHSILDNGSSCGGWGESDSYYVPPNNCGQCPPGYDGPYDSEGGPVCYEPD